MEALIYKIDRLNTHNGPGFRTVVYFKGCPLHCTWCHNPEGISFKPEVWFNASKCIGCNTCVEECPNSALSLSEKGIDINRSRCTGCQHCVSVCPTKAMEAIGEKTSVEELMRIIKQDKMLFEASNGGLTVTGGEPGSHLPFVIELFKQCQAQGIHTAFDTSGVIPVSQLEKVLAYTDLLFLDLKIAQAEKLHQYTGLALQHWRYTVQFLNNYTKEHPELKIEIRTPLVPKVNDDNESLKAMETLLNETFTKVPDWEWCMFNDLCEDKYNRMGMHWQHQGCKHQPKDYQRLNNLTSTLNTKVLISGFVNKSADDQAAETAP